MKKTLLLLLCLLILCSAAVSCTTAAKPDSNQSAASNQKAKYTIGYDIYWLGNGWSVQLWKEFVSEAAKQKDLIENVIYTESESNAEKQVKNLQDLIAKNVDIIFTTPINPTASIPVLKKAKEKGILVVLVASTIEDKDAYDIYVDNDDYEFGKIGAEWLAKKLNNKGKVVMLNGMAGITASESRKAGAADVFKKYPDIEVVASPDCDWDYAKAKMEMSNLLALNTQIDGVWCQGGNMTVATIEAFQAVNRPLVPMTGDAYNGFMKIWQKLKSSGFDSSAPSKVAWLSSEALRLALKYKAGEKVEKDNVLPCEMITAENLDANVIPDLADDFWAPTRMSKEELSAMLTEQKK